MMESCKDGKCGKCPACEKKKSLMAMGYSEKAVEAVMFEFGEREIMEMVKTRLKVMHGLLSDIEESIAMKPNGSMSPWMVDKITMSADYLSAVADNAKYGDGLDNFKEGDGHSKAFDKGKYGKGLSKSQKESAKASSKKAMKADEEGKSLKEQYKPWASDKAHNKGLKEKGKKTPKSKHTEKYERMYGKDSEDNAEDSSDFAKKSGTGKSLAEKARKSGISLSVLRKVYQRGMGAWKSGHRPGMSPQAWAMARVNSFITGGGARKADKDLLGGGKKKKKKK